MRVPPSTASGTTLSCPPAAPQPPPPPLPGPDLHALADPAITAIPRTELDALAASLELPWAAAREQRLHLALAVPRRHNSGGLPCLRKLGLPARPPAAVYRYRLGMTCQAIAGPLGTGHSVISVTTRQTAALLPPAAPRSPRPAPPAHHRRPARTRRNSRRLTLRPQPQPPQTTR